MKTMLYITIVPKDFKISILIMMCIYFVANFIFRVDANRSGSITADELGRALSNGNSNFLYSK